MEDIHSLDLEIRETGLIKEINYAWRKKPQKEAHVVHSDGDEANLELGWYRNKAIGNWGDIKVFWVNWRFQMKVLQNGGQE